ncbi:MAG: choline dehydrogenase [Rhodospirillales bacterium]
MNAKTFDYIVVGAGSAGCTLANRLSENPANQVLVLEAGGKDSNIWIHVPIGYAKTLDKPGLNWRFDSEPEERTYNRQIPIPRGKVLGGSSSINGLLYVRGQHQDYDHWAQLGCTGWSFEQCLPFFKKSENFERGGDDMRGSEGPLNVMDMPSTHELLDAFIDAGEQAGYPRNPDYNGKDQEGFGYYQVTQKAGRRWSTAKAYLEPALKRPNLHLETDAHTTRLLFEGKRCVGVEVVQRGKTQQYRAGREVVLAAGAIQSPQILELSGIGQADLLKSLGIQVNHELPGVGENHHDHYLSRPMWRLTKNVSINNDARGVRLVNEVFKYVFGRKGLLTYPAGIVHGFVKTRPELETPDVQYHIAHASITDIKTRALEKEPGMTCAPCQLRPQSRGFVHIKSADPFAQPRIVCNFLKEYEDQQAMIGGLKIARRLVEQPALRPYVKFEITPGQDCRTDDELLDFALRTGATVYHPVGACKMGPDSDPTAVVDPRLKVRGISGLRVADGSIMPQLVSGNTNAPIIMIAEKAAAMMLEDAQTNVAA